MAFDLRAEVTRRIRAGRVDLPVYPGVALKLQRLVASGNFGLGELAKLVEADRGLAVAVLRAANSASRGSSTSVTTLAQAITRIGASELSNIAIAATLGATASAAGPLAGLRRESWRRSLVDALLAQGLAKQRGLSPGEAFLAGLLCNFGESIAYSCFEAILGAAAEARTAAEWEQEAFALHLELGTVLAETWKLPPFVAEVVMRHHGGEVAGCDFPGLVSLVATTSELSPRVLSAPAVDAMGLDSASGLTRAEQGALAALCSTIPEVLRAFEEVSPEATPGPSAVKRGATTLPPPLWPIDLSVSIDKRGRAEPYRATGISHLGALLEGKAPQPERHLVVLQLPDFRVTATVKRCETLATGSVLEVHPFAMDRATLGNWTAIVRAAKEKQP